MAHHLHHCPYHLRLLKTWLKSGQELTESLYGFEGCSMVPSIYPLETLHNSLSLKQVDEFLNIMCESSSEAHARTMKALSGLFDSQSQTSLYSPQQPLSSSGSETSLRPPSQPLWHGSIPSSAVSSAGPSSPITESSGLNFSFNTGGDADTGERSQHSDI